MLDKQLPKIAVIIPTYNRLNFLLECLESVYAQKRVLVEAIVIDDNSQDDTSLKVRQKFPQTQIIKGDGNLWWSRCVNLGLQSALAANFDYCLLLNDDNLLKDDAVAALLKLAEEHPGSIIGSLVLFWQTNKVNYASIKLKWALGGIQLRDIEQPYQNQYQGILPTDTLAGQGVLLSRSILEQYGLLDTAAFPHYYGDTDYYLRLKAKGVPLLIHSASIVWNRPNENVAARVKDWWQAIARLKKLYFWIGSPYNLRYNWRFYWRHCPLPWLPLALAYRFSSSLRYYYLTTIRGSFKNFKA